MLNYASFANFQYKIFEKWAIEVRAHLHLSIFQTTENLDIDESSLKRSSLISRCWTMSHSRFSQELFEKWTIEVRTQLYRFIDSEWKFRDEDSHKRFRSSSRWCSILNLWEVRKFYFFLSFPLPWISLARRALCVSRPRPLASAHTLAVKRRPHSTSTRPTVLRAPWIFKQVRFFFQKSVDLQYQLLLL